MSSTKPTTFTGVRAGSEPERVALRHAVVLEDAVGIGLARRGGAGTPSGAVLVAEQRDVGEVAGTVAGDARPSWVTPMPPTLVTPSAPRPPGRAPRA